MARNIHAQGLIAILKAPLIDAGGKPLDDRIEEINSTSHLSVNYSGTVVFSVNETQDHNDGPGLFVARDPITEDVRFFQGYCKHMGLIVDSEAIHSYAASYSDNVDSWMMLSVVRNDKIVTE